MLRVRRGQGSRMWGVAWVSGRAGDVGRGVGGEEGMGRFGVGWPSGGLGRLGGGGDQEELGHLGTAGPAQSPEEPHSGCGAENGGPLGPRGIPRGVQRWGLMPFPRARGPRSVRCATGRDRRAQAEEEGLARKGAAPPHRSCPGGALLYLVLAALDRDASCR